jgi:hypothetical protein
MKTLKDYSNERLGRGKIVKKYRVPSKSQKDKYYLVEIDDAGKMFCECVAGSFKNKCSHQKIVEKWIN